MNMYDLLYGNLVKGSSTTTLEGALRAFRSDLELTDTLSATVAGRQKLVRERAEGSALIDVYDTKLIGSYDRATQIRSIDRKDFIDVDSLLIMKLTDSNRKKYWDVKDGGTRALEDLQKSLDGYQGIKAVIDRPAVTLTWANMKMEMVPTFFREGGGYLIPSVGWWSNEWQSTDPVTDGARISAANKAAGGDFVPLVKMLKGWNRTAGKFLGSFAIETILYHYSGSSFYSIRNELPKFFRTVSQLNGKSLAAPSGIGKHVSISFPYWEQFALEQAASKVSQAYQLADIGQHQPAIKLMADVFGNPFQGAT